MKDKQPSDLIRSRVFKIVFDEYEDFHICHIDPLPVVGKGSSPLDALLSLVYAVPEVYDSWADNIDYPHVQDSKQLNCYKELTYMMDRFEDEPLTATYYQPIK
jgi:hypothetical protein